MARESKKVSAALGWVESDHLVSNPTINRSVYQGRPTDDKILLNWSREDRELAAAFTHTDPWRIMRMQGEFVEGFDALAELGPAISIFGSARVGRDSPYFVAARETGRRLAEVGFTVMTGGGPGIMEAANKGAQSVNGRSCGLSIDLPMESASNQFIDRKYNLSFRYFFVRKVMFIRYAQGYVFLPGGVGTLDELFEALTLIQTQKIHPFPIYLMGKSYWEGLIEWIKNTMLAHGCISPEDLDLFHVTDDPEEVANGIERHYQKHRVERNF